MRERRTLQLSTVMVLLSVCDLEREGKEVEFLCDGVLLIIDNALQNW